LIESGTRRLLHLAPLAGRGRPATRSGAGRVRGSLRGPCAWIEPLTPPSPREEEPGEGARFRRRDNST